MLRNSYSGYGWVAILFHWTMAVLIICMLALGLIMTSMPQSNPLTFQLYQLHKSFGIVVLALAVLRLAWRAVNPGPKLPETSKAWELAAAKLGHAGLYALMLLIPLSGWLMVSTSPLNIPTLLFNVWQVPHIPVPAFFGSKQQVTGFFSESHELLAYVLIALLVLHVAAALKHHFIERDQILRRMISTGPGRDPQ
ncbi:cytochrome b [Roseibium sp. RKSG952]|uniref:cytochrome b n=1 Tax=Roseibium sp. RKSG952 TaxID=2529384 RepID=UPI0012BBFE9D|nr:cytochrome b [Roseibium sp. RKSG952]MTH98927.1 cytochrome b [Roseibium sp. RKSG952]